MQDVHGPVAAAQPGQAVRHRVPGHGGGLPGGFGQGQPGRQAGRQRRRVGAPGAMGRRDAATGDRDGQVPCAVEEVIDRLGAVPPGDQGRPCAHGH